MRRRGFTTGAGLVVGALLLACSGCGGSASHKSATTYGRAETHSGTIKYLGHTHSIASDKLPTGSAFSITGQPYLFMGRHYLEVRTHFVEPAQVKEGSSSWSQESGGLEWGTQTGCEGHPFVIVYGLLKNAEDSAFTRISGKLVEYRKTTLPASLHTTGALFYGTSSSPASGLIVRAPNGKPIVSQGSGIVFEAPEGVCSHSQRPSNVLQRLPRLRRAVAQIVQCLRHHGFDVTHANLTGPGPVFNTHGINVKSARYTAARTSCGREALRGLRSSENDR
jgi:hypothetical protein